MWDSPAGLDVEVFIEICLLKLFITSIQRCNFVFTRLSQFVTQNIRITQGASESSVSFSPPLCNLPPSAQDRLSNVEQARTLMDDSCPPASDRLNCARSALRRLSQGRCGTSARLAPADDNRDEGRELSRHDWRHAADRRV